MGYTISIGNAVLKRDDDWDEPYQRIEVEPASHDDAPDHDRYTGKGNSRSPSYTVWHDFCKEAGIYPLFYGSGWNRSTCRYDPCPENFHRETPLIIHHPGAEPISVKDADYVSNALKNYKMQNPDAVPGFWDTDKHHNEIDNGKDPILARLVWLEFWFRWAVENCQYPTVENT